MPLILAPLLPYVLSVLGKLTIKDIIYIGVVIGIIIGCAYIWKKGEDHGRNVIARQVEQQNSTAKKAADGAGLDVDQCYDAGLRWDQSTGQCQR